MLGLYYSACPDLLSPAGVSEAFRRCCLGLEDAVTNILASIESGVIPAKEGSEMICRQRDSPVELSSVCRVEDAWSEAPTRNLKWQRPKRTTAQRHGASQSIEPMQPSLKYLDPGILKTRLFPVTLNPPHPNQSKKCKQKLVKVSQLKLAAELF